MDLFSNMIAAVTWQNMVMMLVGAFLLYLSIEKNFEPTLLLPMGFGTLLVNLPLSSALDQMAGTEMVEGALSMLASARNAVAAAAIIAAALLLSMLASLSIYSRKEF